MSRHNNYINRLYELLICIYKLRIEINNLDENITDCLAKLDELKKVNDNESVNMIQELTEAKSYITKLEETANDIEKIANEEFQVNIKKIISIFKSKIKQLTQDSQTLKQEHNAKLMTEKSLLSNYKSNQKVMKENLFELKGSLTTLIMMHIDYYSELLRVGVDVRGEGISWIVVSLLELNCILKYEMFPRFLKKEHVDYLIRLGEMHIYYNQSKIIVQHYKEIELLQKVNKKENDEAAVCALKRNEQRKLSLSVQTSFMFGKLNMFDLMSFNKHKSRKDVIRQMRKDESDFRTEVAKRDLNTMLNVDNEIKNFTKELRKLKINGPPVAKNPILESYSEQYIRKNRRFLEVDVNKKEIVKYRKKSEEILFQITNLRKKEIEKFKREFEGLKNVNQNTKIEYDMMFCALFGHNTLH